MLLTTQVRKILDFYESDNPGVKVNLARLLMHGDLGGSGKLIILPVDQGFEHGPGRSYAVNPAAYHPHYHFELAVEAGLSAYAAPLGWLEAGASTFAGAIPTILKMNSSNSLLAKSLAPDQAITASISDALRLGCAAIGFTIYPGSDRSLEMFEEIAAITRQAKQSGLAVVIWSYPRGNFDKAGETAVDVVAYGAHIASLLGAHIVKVKLPTATVAMAESRPAYLGENITYKPIEIATLADRVRHVKESCFAGRRLVVFSGGDAKDVKGVLGDTNSIKDGGGDGSIIGRNCFQRPRAEALALLKEMVKIYNS